ncbi:hypothetical protein BH24BAC1_BH24BAC1_00850 [soil metagenome]
MVKLSLFTASLLREKFYFDHALKEINTNKCLFGFLYILIIPENTYFPS